MSNYVMISDDHYRELSATRYDDACEEALESLGWTVVTEEEGKELFDE
jgi:hypothetical protein